MAPLAALAFAALCAATIPARASQATSSKAPAPAQSPAPPSLVTPPASAEAKPEPAPVSKEEEDSYRAFLALTEKQTDLIISQGQAFLSKYALSAYRPSVYSRIEIAYLNTNQVDKLIATGQLALNEDPDNLAVLALMSATLPRLEPRGIDAAQRLDLAERYARRAIHLGASVSRPAGMTEEQFERARNEQLAMAHTGLGLVSYRRGDTAATVSELDQATKLDPTPDPIDFYLLGDGQMKLKQYTEAVAAFDRCAKAQWDASWQTRCKEGEAAALKASAAKPAASAKP